MLGSDLTRVDILIFVQIFDLMLIGIADLYFCITIGVTAFNHNLIVQGALTALSVSESDVV